MPYPGTSHCVTETHFRPSSESIKEERGLLYISSSACSPWSAVHMCVHASACTAAIPAFSVTASVHQPPGGCHWSLHPAKPRTVVLTKPTPIPAKDYSALALSEVINQLQPKQTNKQKPSQKFSRLLRGHLYKNGGHGNFERNLSMQPLPFVIALAILPSTNYRGLHFKRQARLWRGNKPPPNHRPSQTAKVLFLFTS